MRRAHVIVAATVAVAALLPPVQAATASTPEAPSRGEVMSAAPVTTAIPRSASGTRTVQGRQGQKLTVQPTTRLAPFGQTVRIKGRGFNERVGIYVGLCLMPRPGAKPTPCGGGVDTSGSTQASAWISSNPPPYGARLAKPYKPGGKFSVRIRVSPRIGSIDCRRVRCAIVARADHTRVNDRTWDVIVPVTFR